MRNNIISGVKKGESNVEIVVIPTDKATSPRLKKVIKFDDTPPGEHPTSNNPTAIPVGKLKR